MFNHFWGNPPFMETSIWFFSHGHGGHGQDFSSNQFLTEDRLVRGQTTGRNCRCWMWVYSPPASKWLRTLVKPCIREDQLRTQRKDKPGLVCLVVHRSFSWALPWILVGLHHPHRSGWKHSLLGSKFSNTIYTQLHPMVAGMASHTSCIGKLLKGRFRSTTSPFFFLWLGGSVTELGVSSEFPQRMIGFNVWWFGTFFIFPYIGNNHPNWLSYFSEGFKPPTRYDRFHFFHCWCRGIHDPS